MEYLGDARPVRGGARDCPCAHRSVLWRRDRARGTEITEHDALARAAAFRFLEECEARHPEALPRNLLARGFEFQGRRIPLLGPQGIFKPAALSYPLSITTTPERPDRPGKYSDELSESGLLRYCFRGTDPMHPDNEGLRQCMRRSIPLVYFHGLVPGSYAARWPVRVVGEETGNLRFLVSLDEGLNVITEGKVAEGGPDLLRGYRSREVFDRLHQRGFRERVLRAYGHLCAVCRLKHAELLDAAHILPDTHPKGLPVVRNGVALCKLHHAAFDYDVIGIRPDHVVKVRKDVLEEEDGPMLLHGLQEFDGERIHVPRPESLKPKREFLEERYEKFRRAV